MAARRRSFIASCSSISPHPAPAPGQSIRNKTPLSAYTDFLPPHGEAISGGRCAVAGLPACRTDGGIKRPAFLRYPSARMHAPLLTPEILLRAYAEGLFPMAERRDDPTLYWVSPEQRGIIPLDNFHVPHR